MYKGKIPIERAVHEFDQLYDRSSEITKIQLKCWLYDCQGRARGSNDCLTFLFYKSQMGVTDYVSMVKGFCIDMSDHGGLDRTLSIILSWSRWNEGGDNK